MPLLSDPDHADRRLIIAAALVETIAAKVKRELSVERTIRGSELVGRRYLPPFRYYYDEKSGLQIGGRPDRLADEQGKLKTGEKEYVQWRVVAVDFVTTDSGTGIVHQRPAFGEVDFQVLLAEQDRFQAGEGPQIDLRRPPMADSRPKRPTTKVAGSRMPTKTSCANCAIADCYITKSNICTSIRSAGGPNRIR